jgi:hypothetical protein
VLWNQGFYQKRLKANNGKPVPEARLPTMMAWDVALASGNVCFCRELFPIFQPPFFAMLID